MSVGCYTHRNTALVCPQCFDDYKARAEKAEADLAAALAELAEAKQRLRDIDDEEYPGENVADEIDSLHMNYVSLGEALQIKNNQLAAELADVKARLALAETQREAAMYVIRESDGLHRLSLSVAEWSQAVADEGGRGKRYAAPEAPAEVGEGSGRD